MAVPTLVAEIDFTGNPSAGYYDKLHSSDGLVSYWRMADAATLTDEMAANTGTVIATPSLVSGALPFDTNQALSFNGSTQRAYVPSSSSLTPTDMTVQGWVKVPSLPGGTRDLVAKRGTWGFQISSTGIVTFAVKNDTSNVAVNSNAPLATNTYYHLTGVHDSTNNMVYLYVDGVLDQSSVWANGREGNDRPIYFAATPSSASPTWQSSTTATGSSTSVTGTAPASVGAGDLLIAHLCTITGGGAITPPTGWVQQAIQTPPNASHIARVYYKIATGTDSYTFTMAVSGFWAIAVSRITGVDAVSPFANPTYSTSAQGAVTIATGSHLGNVDNNLVLALFTANQASTFTEDSGTTERYDFTGGGGGVGTVAMSSLAQASAAALNVTGTVASGTQGKSVVMLIVSGAGYNSHTAVTEDDWTFWNRVLSADEVLSQFTARLSGVGAWVNVTNDLKSASTNTGRQYELNRMEAGTSTVALNDLQRRYDPANTNSPFSPNIIPLRKMRLRATKGSTYPVFRGFVERWPERWVGPSYAETTLTLVDGFEPLALAGVSGTLPSALSGTQINTLLDKAGWPSADRTIDAGLFTMATTELTADATALGEIQEIADSELGIFFIDAAGIATFHDRAHRWTQTRSLVSQATFVDAASGGGVLYTDLQPSFDKDKTINEWRVSTAQNESATDSDQISAGAFFKRSQTRSTRLDNLPDAQTQATALVRDTAKPALRFDSLTVKPVTDTDWTTVLGLAISDRVTVIRNPVPAAGGSTISKFCFVEGINWQLVPGNTWQVAFQLSPIISATYYDTIIGDGPVSYWRLDTVT
jgi:hypothetical protein